MRHFGKLVMVGMAAASLAVATGSASAADDIVLGYVDDLSALVAEAGNDSLKGVKLAVSEANATGGVGGKKIRLVVYDGKVDTQLTSTYISRAIEDDGAVAVFGGNVSGAIPSAMTIVNEEKVPFFSMSAATDSFTNPVTPYFFRFGPSNSQDAAAVAQLISEAGLKKVAIINNSLPFGLDGSKAITAALKEKGVDVVINEVYEVNSTDVSPQVVKVRDAKPEAVVVWPYPADGGRVLRTMAQLNLNVPTVIARVALFDAFRELAGKAADGVLVPNTVDTERPEVKAMLDKLTAEFGQRPPTMYIAMGYDGAKAAIQALQDSKVQAALKSDDLPAARVALRDALESIGTFSSLQGAAGNTLKFSSQSHQGLHGNNIFVWAQVQDGKLKKADPKSFAPKN
ncbi:ABC transporter substrate-binding protein [Microvirga antarctica]|uniref:ABC transporter substrate-binding protein n=1 Tax=Microvirga antarctica TaxID=2819233 RepID=UPI001B30D68A|nr:ABC transporter substrate-binding protein [Microvirga antarctica]